MPPFAKAAVLTCLRELADGALQDDSWLRGKPGGPASPAELVCQLFDDTALGDYLRMSGEQPVFSVSTDAVLGRISALIDELDLDAPPHLLLRRPQWREAQERAAEAVALIEALDGG